MSLAKYQQKRKFTHTPEPAGSKKERSGRSRLPIFVIHKHAATRLHYDLRLEHQGVLKSWPVPKGPSYDPHEKRLAIMVEDHPLEYAQFKGEIPEGNYGAGKVEIWDQGTYCYPDLEGGTKAENEKMIEKGIQKGHIRMKFFGKRMKGLFELVRFKTAEQNMWLLIKAEDEYAGTGRLDENDETAESAGEIENSDRDTINRVSKSVDRSPAEILASAPQAKKRMKLEPMLAKLAEEPFNRSDTLFEIKYDGYRALAVVGARRQVAIFSRNGADLTRNFEKIAQALIDLPAGSVLDGELVVKDETGRSDYSLLKSYLASGKGTAEFIVFDLPIYSGKDLSRIKLLERKTVLQSILPKSKAISYSDHIIERGKELYQEAVKHNLEGIMAKAIASQYEWGQRSGSWKKIKLKQELEVIVVGLADFDPKSKEFGALAVALREGDDLRFIGKVGTGFTTAVMKILIEQLAPDIASDPVVINPPAKFKITWLLPKYHALVKFSEFTSDGMLRHPVFLNLVKAAVKKTENFTIKLGKTEVELSNQDKVFWPKLGFTKGDVVEYYRALAPTILPYLVDRPQSLKRHPDGIDGESFFQKNMPAFTPDWIQTEAIRSDDKVINYMLCQDEVSLIYMANLGCIELNPWHSRLRKLDNPDYFVFDLDPVEIDFAEVTTVANTIHEVLQEFGIDSYAKSSGMTGLHIYVPLGAKYTYDQALLFGKIVVELVHEKLPKITSNERRPVDRRGKIYLDIYQNRRGQTMAAPYSLRPFPGAQVAAPLTWDEVNSKLKLSDYNIETMLPRLVKLGDIWKQVLGKGVDLKKAFNKS